MWTRELPIAIVHTSCVLEMFVTIVAICEHFTASLTLVATAVASATLLVHFTLEFLYVRACVFVFRYPRSFPL
jgi:hypothetical protein